MPSANANAPVMKLHSTLGDKLQFRALSAREELGRLYEFQVLALAEPGANVDPAALLGQPACVSIERADNQRRYFHGQVVQAGLEGAEGGLLTWRLQLRPWLWRLTRRADNRIFQNLTTEAILKKVFANYTGNVVFELSGTYIQRLYCVQYRETDFNFVSRLMEEEGMYYFHRHEEGSHTLVICDKMTSHADYPGHATLKYRETQDQLISLGSISEWRTQHALTPGKVTLTDYDYLNPGTSLVTHKDSDQGQARAVLEHYDHPGLYLTTARGNNLARVRMQEQDARVLRVSAFTSTLVGVCTGYRFALQDHPLASENTNHVVVATQIDARYAGYESGQGETHFTCRIDAMRYAHPFRPERITPKPVIPGPQTAVVIGPSGEEIHTDEHGRVKVRFHWDRAPDNEVNTHDRTCWLRVASGWAGKAWGMISLPRIGQEVVVDFLEGDPDRPLVTSRVYNAVQVVPYALPANKTVSTIKSQSSKGGTTANANELRFEDKKGSEYIWFQAEKDFNHLVKHNSKTLIQANEDRVTGGDLTEKIKGKYHRDLVGNYRRKVGGDFSSTVLGDHVHAVTGFYQMTSANAVFETEKTQFQSTEWHQIVDGPMKIEASDGYSLKAATVSIEASTKISLKVGGNFVVIDSSGVSIKGTMVNINTGGMADSAQAPTDVDPSEVPVPDAAASPEDPLTPNA